MNKRILTPLAIALGSLMLASSAVHAACSTWSNLSREVMTPGSTTLRFRGFEAVMRLTRTDNTGLPKGYEYQMTKTPNACIDGKPKKGDPFGQTWHELVFQRPFGEMVRITGFTYPIQCGPGAKFAGRASDRGAEQMHRAAIQIGVDCPGFD